MGQWQNSQRNAGRVDPVTNVTRSLVSPLANGFSALNFRAADLYSGFVRAPALTEENRRLKDLAQSAEFYTEQVDRLNRQINELRLLTQLGPLPGRERLATDIIGYFPRENRITLSIGERSGVKKGMPVESGRGLVGIIETVEANRCQALLITSRGLTVGGMVLNRNPAQVGFIRGQDGMSVVLSLQDPKSPVEVGDTVITSGFGDLIPRGVIVGKVVQVIPSEEFGTVRAIVDPVVNLGALKEVFILK